MCGGPGMDMKVSTTIGYERANNHVLSIEDEDEFVKQALDKLGPQPPNFQAIVEMNKGPLLTDGVELLRLAPRQVEQKRSQGALLVDVRTDLQFDEAHIAGAVCIPLMRAGGIDNPLGARAMYLGSTLYRIHGSNEPETIGQAVSSGCFRMTNDDVTDLYSRVSVGTTVVVKN